jgi:hypothetical protein
MTEAALVTYSEFLTVNKLVPRPAFWSHANFTGRRYPESVEEATADLWDPPFEPISVFYPLYSTFDRKLELYGSEDVEIIEPDVRSGTAPSFWKTLRPFALKWTLGTEEEVKLAACTGTQWTFGHAFQGATSECDAVVTQLCKQGTAYSDGPLCVCFRDREKLDLSLPVRCLGPRCVYGGYRTVEMSQQGCDLTLCESLVSLQGNNLVSDANVEIQCGFNHFTPEGKVVALPKTPQSIWNSVAIAAAVILVVLALAVGLIIRFRQ